MSLPFSQMWLKTCYNNDGWSTFRRRSESLQDSPQGRIHLILKLLTGRVLLRKLNAHSFPVYMWKDVVRLIPSTFKGLSQVHLKDGTNPQKMGSARVCLAHFLPVIIEECSASPSSETSKSQAHPKDQKKLKTDVVMQGSPCKPHILHRFSLLCHSRCGSLLARRNSTSGVTLWNSSVTNG